MALIECPECNHEVSDRARSCPECGYPINDQPGTPTGNNSSCCGCLLGLIILVFILSLI